MKIKAKIFFIGWLIFTILLSILLFSGVYSYSKIVEATTNPEVKVEEKVLEMPSIKVREKNVEVEKVVENVSYDFPFKVSEGKNISTIGVCDCCLSNKKYPKMRSNEDITVYASSNLYKEGTLLWIEGVGIRQVQATTVSSDSLYIYFNTHNEATAYGNKTIQVFEILE